MSDVDRDQLAEDVREFDKLMATHDTFRMTDETNFVFVDDVDSAKPDVDADDAEYGGIELAQFPVTNHPEKSKQLTV